MRRWGRAGLAALATAALVAMSPPVGATAIAGRCFSPLSHVDSPGVENYLSESGAWLRIRAVDRDARADGTYGGRYDIVGGDAGAVLALRGGVDAVAMSRDEARRLRWAVRVAPEVFGHVGGIGGVRSLRFAVAFSPDDFAFVGECARGELTEPLKQVLGPGARDTLRGLVGRPGAAFAAAFPRSPHDWPRPPDVTLRPGSPAAAGLLELALTVPVVPPRWRGNVELCAGSTRGWSGCVDLSRPAPLRTVALVDPSDGRLQLWLRGPSGPYARVARVPLAEAAEYSGVQVGDVRRVVVTLDETASLARAAREPESGHVAVELGPS